MQDTIPQPSDTRTSPVGEGAGAVALLERRVGMSADLFSRYWRDVHGVLATRIPGFTSYRQYHIDRDALYREGNAPLPMNIDGIAEVLFSQLQSGGLVSSQVAELIRADEQNVFSRAHLYSLPAGASHAWSAEPYDRNEHLVPAPGPGQQQLFLLFQNEAARPTVTELHSVLRHLLDAVPRVHVVHSHLLAAGDVSWWNTPGVDNGEGGAPFVAAVKLHVGRDFGTDDQVKAISPALQRRPVTALGRAALFGVNQRYVMVHGGEPSEIGLRGLDAFRTIGEAAAENQRSSELLRSLYRYP
jgi:hypothetical protein